MRRLPHDHEPYTDDYFLNEKKILEEEGINPHQAIKGFCRSTFQHTELGAQKLTELFEALPSDRNVRAHIREPDTYQPGEPLFWYEGSVQDIVDLETVLLGEASSILTQEYTEQGSKPWPARFRKRVQEAARIYRRANIPLLYFGARHYTWRMDKELAKMALDAGAVQTSTFVGSSNIYKSGVGTTPHSLFVTLASQVGMENATLEGAKLFHEHMESEVPRTILIDTRNRELTDAIKVLEYFHEVEPEAEVGLRIDTCGENIAETGEPESSQANSPPYTRGTGVTTTAVWNLHRDLLEEGFEDFNLFVSSGMGKPDKAKAFVNASQVFEEEFGRPMFHGVGAGDFAPDTIQCTADPFMVDGEAIAKVGREVDPEEVRSYEYRTVTPNDSVAGGPELDMLK